MPAHPETADRLAAVGRGRVGEVNIDPKTGVSPSWPGCRVISRSIKALGDDRFVVEADEAAIAPARAIPGVTVARAGDGDYVDDSRAVYTVSGGGTVCRRTYP
jgi:hypothetical protein